MSPLCESYVPEDKLDEAEVFYPLHVRLCDACLLVQLPAYVSGEDIFSDYAYFSSYSDSWVAHAKRYADPMIGRLSLTPGQPGHRGGQQRRLPAPALPGGRHPGARRRAGRERGRGGPGPRNPDGGPVPRRRRPAARSRERHGRADLVAANNVFAHVPDIRGFAAGLRALVKDDGLVTLEFPHLLRLIERRQYDTIYHEHFSYLSLLTASSALATAGLRVVDVEELGTHGGSLRVYARPEENAPASRPTRVKAVLDEEDAAGLHTVAGHDGFAAEVLKIKSDLLGFLLGAAREGRSVAGYGAPGKGNTLLNHCGIRSDLLSYTVDRSPVKQGKFLPGTHIPIYAPERLAETKPDYILVLPWNLRDEISRQLELRRIVGRKARRSRFRSSKSFLIGV